MTITGNRVVLGPQGHFPGNRGFEDLDEQDKFVYWSGQYLKSTAGQRTGNHALILYASHIIAYNQQVGIPNAYATQIGWSTPFGFEFYAFSHNLCGTSRVRVTVKTNKGDFSQDFDIETSYTKHRFSQSIPEHAILEEVHFESLTSVDSIFIDDVDIYACNLLSIGYTSDDPVSNVTYVGEDTMRIKMFNNFDWGIARWAVTTNYRLKKSGESWEDWINIRTREIYNIDDPNWEILDDVGISVPYLSGQIEVELKLEWFNGYYAPLTTFTGVYDLPILPATVDAVGAVYNSTHVLCNIHDIDVESAGTFYTRVEYKNSCGQGSYTTAHYDFHTLDEGIFDHPNQNLYVRPSYGHSMQVRITVYDSNENMLDQKISGHNIPSKGGGPQP